MPRGCALAAALLAIAMPGSAVYKVRQTAQCGLQTSPSGVKVYGSAAGISRVQALLASDPAAFWTPERTVRRDHPLIGSTLVLTYPELQDLWEIGRKVQSVAAGPDVSIYWEGAACPAVSPPYPPSTEVAFELHDQQTGEYRLVADGGERRALLAHDRWQLTGQSFAVAHGDLCSGVQRIARFSLIGTRGLGTEVLTADPVECGNLRGSGEWYARDVPFHAFGPREGRCPDYSRPVTRLFNGAQVAPNHRYTVERSIARDMVAGGWIDEGVAFCVPDGTHPYLRWFR